MRNRLGSNMFQKHTAYNPRYMLLHIVVDSHEMEGKDSHHIHLKTNLHYVIWLHYKKDYFFIYLFIDICYHCFLMSSYKSNNSNVCAMKINYYGLIWDNCSFFLLTIRVWTRVLKVIRMAHWTISFFRQCSRINTC